jgi:hypothetical protein
LPLVELHWLNAEELVPGFARNPKAMNYNPAAYGLKVSETISKGKELSIWITDSLAGLTFPHDQRTTFAVSAFDLALEQHDAIILLIERGLPGAAISLLRASFESYIRGMWALECARDSQIIDVERERLNRGMDVMIRDLERLEAYDTGILSNSWNDAKKILHSFMNSGYRHVMPAIEVQLSGPGSLEREILGAIGYANAVAIMCIIAFAGICNKDELASTAFEKAKEYSAH